MADKIVIEGIAPYDGAHEFDSSYFTMGELHTIKKLTGLRAGELDEALAAGDADVIVALAVIALERNGARIDAEAFWNAPMGTISFVPGDDDRGEDDGDARPPESASGSSSSSETTSGDGSPQPSEPATPETQGPSPSPENDPSSTGTPASGTSESPPIRLAG